MIKTFDHKVIKTALASFLAYLLSDYFGLKYGLTASIVAIISIQSTKTESIKITFERFLAVLLGISIFVFLVFIMGFQYITLGIFILIFMPLCIKFDILQGFLVTTVLATHILTEKSISKEFLINEISILILGLLIGNILNLYMPNNEKKIDLKKTEVDDTIKKILSEISETLKCNCVSVAEDNNFKHLKNIIEDGRKLSLLEYQNSLFEKCNNDLNFFSMRRRQYRILTRIRIYFKRLYITYEHSLILSNFISHVSENIDLKNDISALLAEHSQLKTLFSKMPLPQTRQEFENRATLYQLLQEMEEFLAAQIDFKNSCI